MIRKSLRRDLITRKKRVVIGDASVWIEVGVAKHGYCMDLLTQKDCDIWDTLFPSEQEDAEAWDAIDLMLQDLWLVKYEDAIAFFDSKEWKNLRIEI